MKVSEMNIGFLKENFTYIFQEHLQFWLTNSFVETWKKVKKKKMIRRWQVF